MRKASFQKLRLREFNFFDTERIIRENIYDLEQENIRIEDLVMEMVEQKIPIPIILGWMRQMENNAAEIVYINSILEHDLNTYDYTSTSNLFIRGREVR